MGEVRGELVGSLVVATPNILDPNFFRTVVLVCEHNDDDGALGVVINRALPADLGEFLPDWRDLAVSPAVVFLGGPVQREVALALARFGADPPEGFRPVAHGIGLFDLSGGPTPDRPAPDGIRVYSGYAGWSAGQLEGELERGDWFVLDPAPDDILCANPDGLWRDILRRQPYPLRLYADFPADPRVN